jgi:hypothetical protein
MPEQAVKPNGPAHPLWKRLRRRFWLRLLRWDPATSFQFAGVLGRLGLIPRHQRLLLQQVDGVYGDWARTRRTQIIREVRRLGFRNTALHDFLAQAGFEGLAPFVRFQNGDRLEELREQKTPAVLIGWHVGPNLAVVSAVVRLGIPTLFLVYGEPPCEMPPGYELCSIAGEADKRILALKRAVNHLRQGGFVFVSMEGRHPGAARTRRPRAADRRAARSLAGPVA